MRSVSAGEKGTGDDAVAAARDAGVPVTTPLSSMPMLNEEEVVVVGGGGGGWAGGGCEAEVVMMGRREKSGI